MLAVLKEIIHWRHLIFFLSVSFTKIKYKQTYLRFAWIILNPLATLVIFNFIFRRVANLPSEGVPYVIFNLTALAPWIFFATSISCSVGALTDNFNLITRINFPRITLIFGSILSSLYDCIVTYLIFIVFMKFYGIKLGMNAFYFFPIFFIQLIFTTGMCVLVSLLNVYLRDIQHAMFVVLQSWMLFSPVGYSAGIITGRVRDFYFLNPMAGILESYRDCLLHNRPPDWPNLLLAALISLAILISGCYLFKRQEPNLSDIV